MNQKRGMHRLELVLICFLILIVLVTISSMFIFRRNISDAIMLKEDTVATYSKHYAFISDEYSNPLMEEIYEEIKQSAEQEYAYVEYFGKNLSVEYPIAELIEIATNARVDGIFVVGDESEEVTKAIDQAVAQSIPVVTVFQDCAMSKRQCFVGVNGYDLGQQYARKLIAINQNTTKNVYLLVNSNQEDAAKNSVYLGIKAYLEKWSASDKILLHGVAIKSKTEFTSDELIRELILDSKKSPNVLICLNSVDTTCAYQAVIDYNKVGEVKILGWDSSELILNGIQKNIIDGTITMDAKEMGKLALQSMKEYETAGYVSQYIPVHTTMIDQKNLSQYIGG